MNAQANKPKEEVIMKSPNFVAILAILNAMVRCFSENIAKTNLTLGTPVLTSGTNGRVSMKASKTNIAEEKFL